MFITQLLDPIMNPLLSLGVLIPLFIVELFTPDEPDAEPEPLIPSLPKSSVLTLPPPEVFFPPVKNEPKAASGWLPCCFCVARFKVEFISHLES